MHSTDLKLKEKHENEVDNLETTKSPAATEATAGNGWVQHDVGKRNCGAL